MPATGSPAAVFSASPNSGWIWRRAPVSAPALDEAASLQRIEPRLELLQGDTRCGVVRRPALELLEKRAGTRL